MGSSSKQYCQAFVASNEHPLDFAASYAFKQYFPPSLVAAAEEEWIDSDIGEDAIVELIDSYDSVTLTPLTNSQLAPVHQHSSHSTSQSQS